MQHGVQSIARAASVLRTLAENPEGIGLAELAGATGLPKSTVHRLVGALAEEGLVHSGAAGIRLGAGLARLGAASRETLRAGIRPVLEQLHRELDETVDLAVLDGASARFIDQIAAPRRLQAVSTVGASFPLHCTANGKALLAALGDERVLALLPARLQRFTANTITARAALLDELARVRNARVAFDRAEHTIGICAVGAAVHDAAGLAGAISVPVPAPRFRGSERRYARRVREAAAEASRLAGGTP
jgi:DNA-binding IclR family transcriptional regulator